MLRRDNNLRKKVVGSSVEYVGKYDPSSSVELRRKAQHQGVIDLCSTVATVAPPIKKGRMFANRKRITNEEFSVPNGKRAKTIYVNSDSCHANQLQERWEEGTFRWVHKGMFTPNVSIPGDDGGPQVGELCVLKEFKTGSVYEEHFFSKDILAVNKAIDIIHKFNNYFSTGMPFLRLDPAIWPKIKSVYINTPKVWHYVDPDTTGKNRKVLCEPMLEGKFLKFNSNNGFVGSSEFMQALSHFSYHETNREYLLCDLQGGHYNDTYVLTDPIIMSQNNSKKYGSGDLGAEGIDNFFAHHTCGRICRCFLKPHRPVKSKRIPVESSSTLSLTLGTHKSDAERMRTLNAAILSGTRT